MKKLLCLLLSVIILISACNKDDDDTTTPGTPEQPALKINLKYYSGNEELVFDSIKYTNAAGNNYSVTSLMYYLSDLKLIKPDSQQLLVKDWIYLDARNSATSTLVFKNVPEGQYLGMTFNIGLNPVQNVTNGLPVTSENTLMEWPIPMGGGYHFLKMEGHWLDSGNTLGYALHLGTNMCLTQAVIFSSICIGQTCNPVILKADVNEWFQQPYTYDLNVDGNYTMGNDTAMFKVAQNGTDVFSIGQ